MTRPTNSPSRRTALKLIASAAVAGTMKPLSAFSGERQLATYRSKAMGCFMGAAIADSMGGPVECQHYKRIAKYFPDFQDHQPYENPPATIFPLRPGYALDAAPGSITDDTFIRMDLAEYLLQNEPPYTAASFAPWLLENAEFSNWWKMAVRPLDRIKRGEVSAEKDLYEKLYAHCLVKECSTEVDGPMPPHLAPVDKMDGSYNGILFAEQQPLALAYFVFGRGDPHKTVLTAVKGGRDADSVTCNSAARLGALAGNDIWPKRWRETVQQANLHRMDLEQTARDLIAKGLKNRTVVLKRI